MGYPMTFRRVVNRNGLNDGDYGKPPQTWSAYGGSDLSQKATLLAGDLRRLERDAVDENAICAHIAGKTGIDREIVAAVLKEFISW
jgi:hypothetical protein